MIIKIISFLLLFLITQGVLFAQYEWPIYRGQNQFISTALGEYRDNSVRFHTGIDVVADADIPVKASHTMNRNLLFSIFVYYTIFQAKNQYIL